MPSHLMQPSSRPGAGVAGSRSGEPLVAPLVISYHPTMTLTGGRRSWELWQLLHRCSRVLPVNVVSLSLRCVWGCRARSGSGNIFRWQEFPGVDVETLFLSRELESKFHIFKELSLINTINGVLYCLCENGCVGCIYGGVSSIVRWLCSEYWGVS